MSNDNEPLTLQMLYDMNVGAALLKQLSFDHLCEHYPAKNWTAAEKDGEGAVDIPGLGIFPKQIIGSEAGETWLWAWANDEIDSMHSNLADHFLSEIEEQFGIKDISDGELPVAEFDGHFLATIVLGLYNNASGIYAESIDDGAGVSYAIYLDLPLKNVAEPVSTVRISAVLDAALADARVEDPLQAVYSFLESIGFEPIVDDEDEAELEAENYTIVFRDQGGRALAFERVTRPDGNFEITYSLEHMGASAALEEYAEA